MPERIRRGPDRGSKLIFSRNRGSGRHAAHGRDDADHEAIDAVDEDGAGDGVARAGGPYDLADAPAGIAHLDLGALRIPAVDGVEVRVQADNDGRIQQVVLVSGESALQLGVFAAPKTEGIWDEVRTEIRKQLFNDGVAAEESEGEHGQELRARVRTPEGLTDIRFVGVNGPRWLVRAVYQGPAAVDPSVAPALVQCLHNLVVNRGQEAMPVRDPLQLHLPREVDEQPSGSDADGADGAAPATRRKPSPRPRRQ
jgi:hypothetical protein